MRLRGETRERLVEATARSGLTISEEIERRVERSFEQEEESGGPHTAALLRMIAGAIDIAERVTGSTWVESQKTRRACAGAAAQVIERFLVEGGPLFDDTAEEPEPHLWNEVGRRGARSMLDRERARVSALPKELPIYRGLLAPLVEAAEAAQAGPQDEAPAPTAKSEASPTPIKRPTRKLNV